MSTSVACETHCFHRPRVSFTIATNPPQWKETCCHCGAEVLCVEPQPAPPPGHGPHHPDARPQRVMVMQGSQTVADVRLL